MGFLDSVKAWFRTEAAEARDLAGTTKGRLEADLDRREADLNLSPSERLEQLQDQIESDGSFDHLRDKIEGREALADATADVADINREAMGDRRDEDILDLPSEEVDPPEPPPATS